ncbi:hypothetical protein NPIL_548441 [Nephila pilipes]|uniref:Uncharacterized protein n=1 Tax=Nephila pilipes TaxID=299642 RepID=A0A8X6U5U7_NEPPI|nr:hypothetical protein NPIL_548441 [Nephila pilipes]
MYSCVFVERLFTTPMREHKEKGELNIPMSFDQNIPSMTNVLSTRCNGSTLIGTLSLLREELRLICLAQRRVYVIGKRNILFVNIIRWRQIATVFTTVESHDI